MSAIINSIPLSIIYVIIITLLTNYKILRPLFDNPDYHYYMYFLLIAYVAYVLHGYLIAIYASKKQCDKINHLSSFVYGNKAYIYVAITFIVISYFSTFTNPFVELFGNDIKGISIAQIYFLSLSLIISSIITYYDSSKENCRVSMDQIEQNLTKLDKYLNEPYPEDKTPNITVKD